MDILALVQNNPQLFNEDACHEIKPKKYIYRQGDPAEWLYFLVEGAVRIVRINFDGEEEVLSYLIAPNIVGIHNVFKADETEKAQISIISETACRYYKVSCARLKQQKNYSDLLEAILITLGEQSREYRNIAVHCLENRSANAVCEMLLNFSEYVDGRLVVNKWFKYIDLANYLKINISTVSRIIRKLKENGIIQIEEKRILIMDEIVLRNYAAGMKMED